MKVTVRVSGLEHLVPFMVRGRSDLDPPPTAVFLSYQAVDLHQGLKKLGLKGFAVLLFLGFGVL